MNYDVSYFARLTPTELHEWLLKKRFPIAMHDKIKKAAAEEKERLRRARIKDTVQEKLWAEVIHPLRAEIRSIKSSLAYRGSHNADERIAAFAAYETVLLKARDKLSALSQQGLVPSEAAKEVEDEYGVEIPNKGTHWVDWVPQSTKTRIAAMFDAVPYTPRAKRKLPFERALTGVAQEKALTKKFSKLTTEAEMIMQELTIAKSELVTAELKASLAAKRKELAVVQAELGKLLSHGDSKPEEGSNG